jgi:hypothetical protein
MIPWWPSRTLQTGGITSTNYVSPRKHSQVVNCQSSAKTSCDWVTPGPLTRNRDPTERKKEVLVARLTERQGEPAWIQVDRGNTSDLRSLLEELTAGLRHYWRRLESILHGPNLSTNLIALSSDTMRVSLSTSWQMGLARRFPSRSKASQDTHLPCLW